MKLVVWKQQKWLTMKKSELIGCPCNEIDKEVEKLKHLKKQLKKNKMCLYQRRELQKDKPQKIKPQKRKSEEEKS